MSGVPSWAVRGQKVVCVQGTSLATTGEVNITSGDVFTIRDILANDDGVGLYLVEVVNPLRLTWAGQIERAYYIDRFRPLVTTKTVAEDLAHFRHHLDQRQPESVQ